MKLIRNIVAVLVGVAVSLVLMSVGGWILAQGPDTRVLIEQKERPDKGIEPTKNEIDQLLTSIERNHRYIRWGMGPMIVFLAGLITALVGIQSKPILGVLGAAPYAIIMTLLGTNPQYAVLALYLVIAGIGGSVPILRERMKSSNKAL